MKLSFARGYVGPSLLINRARPICSSSSSSSSSSLKSKTPLFLQPAIYSTTSTDLQKWYKWAKTLSSSIGSSFLESDNGPDSTLLRRELRWLVDDAVSDPSLSSKLSVHHNDHDAVKNVSLRVRIEELYELWKQRIDERKPFQYIVGCEHWRDLVLSVREGVLIPRPETELMVDLVAEAVLNNDELREGLWADLGTGSGAIAIGIGRVLGQRGGGGRVIATDLSPVALEVTGFNIQRYGLQDAVVTRLGSWFEPLKNVEGRLCGVVSNPPYIPSDDIHGLQAEVGRHEPKLALDGGTDGMNDLFHLCNGAAYMLKPGGFFAFETNGEKQCKHLVNYIEDKYEARFCSVKIVTDFRGIQRFVTGFRRAVL